MESCVCVCWLDDDDDDDDDEVDRVFHAVKGAFATKAWAVCVTTTRKTKDVTLIIY
jgi:hypothetical protein